MVNQNRFFHNKVFVTLFGVLIVPLLRLLGMGGGDAFATDTACYAGQCTLNNTRWVTCGTSQVQMQTCTSCTYEAWVCLDYPYCSEYGPMPTSGTYWKDTGSCVTATNQCSYVGQTSSTSCT
ncbi:MAG: hypothetical protein JW974_00290, partial [Alphaproteobacteria bacterium]|nr:hypothetical protein [Alphaproteobacteria bacterium]